MQDSLISTLYRIYNTLSINRLYLCFILMGLLFTLAGIYVSVYKSTTLYSYKKSHYIKSEKYIRILELFTNKLPLKILSDKLSDSISYFLLQDLVQRKIVAVLTLVFPVIGILMFLALNGSLNIWYTKSAAFLLCLVVPYYVFTLVVDYMKYSLRVKIPNLIDGFRSSFMLNYRIQPALLECSKNMGRSLGRIMSRASDSSDLNCSLGKIGDRINDTWFNIFVLLLVNYRENGGELIAQLYKLNRTITRYNNIEKKKNKRLIWYEIFTVSASILSLPVILLLNKMILGANTVFYYDITASFGKITLFSLCALIMVRILRRI